MSFAPQLACNPGKPRQWVFVMGGIRWYARETKWKLRENGQLFDVSNSPYAETLVLPASDTPESKSARTRLQTVLDTLHPVPNEKAEKPRS